MTQSNAGGRLTLKQPNLSIDFEGRVTCLPVVGGKRDRSQTTGFVCPAAKLPRADHTAVPITACNVVKQVGGGR